MYHCNRCNYKTDIKQAMIKHLNKKNVCDPINSDIDRQIQIDILKSRTINDINYSCKYCEKKFNNRSNMYVHRKICKDRDKENANGLSELKSEFNKLILKNKELEDKINNITIHPITNNTQNNINVTIPKLKNFGWENMDAIPESLISSLFMNLRFKELLANLHCDPNFPENQNVRIKSVKRNTMEIYRNNKWDIVTFTKGLTDLLLQGHRIFTDYYNKDKERILEEDMDEQDLREILSQLQKIQDLNKSEIKPLIEDLQMMLEEYRENGHAIVLA